MKASTIITAADSTTGKAMATHRLPMPIRPGIHSESRAIDRAANRTMAPCAKLNTPEALKISTKPSATSE